MLGLNCVKDEQIRKKYCVVSLDFEFLLKVLLNGVGLSLRVRVFCVECESLLWKNFKIYDQFEVRGKVS